MVLCLMYGYDLLYKFIISPDNIRQMAVFNNVWFRVWFWIVFV